jgi:phage shock protein A
MLQFILFNWSSIMIESLSGRLRRIVRARVECLVDRIEQESSPEIMAEAVREMERLMDDVAREKDQCVGRRLAACRSQALLRERLADLEAKARFALAQGREDLAEIALSRQLDFEASLASLDGTIAAADEEEARLGGTLAELTQRRDAMANLSRAAEATAAESVTGLPGPNRLARAADRAEGAFRRALGDPREYACAVASADAYKGLGEIERLSRQSLVAERLDKLRAAAPVS